MKFKRKALATLAVVGLTTGFAGSALASDVTTAVVDTTAPNTAVSVKRGESVNITINWSVTGRQDAAAKFEMKTEWSLASGAFVGSNAVEGTVNARAAGDPATTGNVSGTLTVDCDQEAGLYQLSVPATVTQTTSPAALGSGTAAQYGVTVLDEEVEACDDGEEPPANAAPTVKTAAGDAFDTEGETLSTSGEFQDVDGDDLTVTVPEGTAGTFTDLGEGKWEWELETNDDVEQAFIEVTASDGSEDGTATDSFDYRADNAAPVATATVGKSTGCGVELDLSWTDAGSADTHTVVIDWDDDSGVNSDGEEDLGTQTSPVLDLAHTFPGTGTYTVVATVTDDDGGFDPESASAVAFNNETSQILDPMKNDGNYKAGSSLPIKITVVDCANRAVTNLTPTVSLVKTGAAIDSDPTLPASTTAAPTNGKSMQWNGEQYIYVLSTKNSQFVTGNGALTQGAYTVTVQGTGITMRTVSFELKK